MNRILNLWVALSLIVVAGTVSAGDKGNLRWLSFNEGLQQAGKTNRKVLVDVYTDWCGWCKKMDIDTYSNKEIVDYLLKKYVLVRLNAESTNNLTYKGEKYTEQQLAAAFGINGYPMTLFLKPDGEAITGYPGYADAPRFMNVLSFIAEDHYLTKKFDEYCASRK